MKNKTVGGWLGLAAGVILLCFDIAYIILDYGDKTFSMPAFVLFLLGVACEVLCVITRLQFVPLLPPLFVAAGVGMHLYQSFPSITDLINKIVFIGGNSQLAVNFAIYFAATGAILVITSFFERTREPA